MDYRGHVKDGMIVLEGAVRLPEGTEVQIRLLDLPAGAESALTPHSFWESPTLQELAEAQRVTPVRQSEELVGGWPEDQIDDGFELEVRRWRDSDLERSA